MPYHLPRLSSGIDQNPKPRLNALGFGDLFGREQHFCAEARRFFIKGVEGIKMLSGDDQDVNRGRRIYVLENYDFLIFEDYIRRQFMSGDLAK